MDISEERRQQLSRAGKIGGRSRSPAKQAAARLNGQRGGRPPKMSKEERDECDKLSS